MNPIDTIKGRIVDYDPMTQELTIKAYYPDWRTLTKREYADCNVELIDSRSMSNKQRKAVYALLREIGKHTGQGLSSTKEAMKAKFAEEELGEAGREFSLSDSPMSLIYAFQKYLVHFILDFDIPCDFPLLDFVDDVQDYVYACAVRRKCCICGRPAVIHHHERIGMGRDREEVEQFGMLIEPLCGIHHNECHTMPQGEFDEKYHIVPVTINEELKKVWGFTGEQKRYDQTEEWEEPDGTE